MFKIITMKNVHVTYTLQFAICTKSTELFKLYSKEKLLFIKVRCLINVNVRLILKDKGGKQYCLPFVGSNLGV